MNGTSPVSWQAKWIWFEKEPAPNRYMQVRRRFHLSGPIKGCSLAISADSHYKLFVNGKFIRRGPVRRVAAHSYYDLIDVTKNLMPGDNCIAVLAHQRFSRQGKLLVQGQVDIDGPSPVVLDTGSTPWRVTSTAAWSTDVRSASAGPDVGFQEVLDLRELPENWTAPEFDDSSWSMPIAVGNPAKDADSGNLSLRDIPPLSEKLISETPVILRACTMKALPDAYGIDLAAVAGATEFLGAQLQAAEDTTVEFTCVGDGNLAIFLDGTCLAFRPKDTPEKARHLTLQLSRGIHYLALRLGRGLWTWTTTYSITPNPSVQFSVEGGEPSPILNRWQVVSNWAENYGEWPAPMKVVPELKTSSTSTALPPIRARLNVAQRMTWEPILKEALFPSTFPVEIPPQVSGQTTSIVVDLGKECVGFPVVDLTSTEDGAVVDVGYGEFLVDGLVPVSHYVNHFADQVTLRPGRQIFEPSFWWKGCRYLQLHFRNSTNPITVHSLAFRECRYAAEPVGHFECSDPILNDIWRVGIRTLQCCMNDAYIDCPSREQKDYLGDGVPQIHANYYTIGDSLLAANLLRQFVRLQRPSGFLGKGAGNILDQNLDFVIIVRLCYLFSGKPEFLQEFYEPSRKLIRAFIENLNEDGLLQNLSDSCWVDHELWDYHDADRSGIRTRLDLRFSQALRAMAYLAKESGHVADAQEFQFTADRVREGIRRILWDPERHLYIDGIKNGKPLATFSLHVNYLAILYDVAPGDQWEPMFRAMTDPGLRAARTFSPFFHYYVHRALFKMESPQAVLDYLHEIWGGYIRSGLTTFPEGLIPSTDSRCHAYSCTPNVDLIADFMGIYPLEPGYRSFAIHPRVSMLDQASAAVPTPMGFIRVAWRTIAEGVQFSISVPSGTKAHFKCDSVENIFAGGEHQLLVDMG